MIPVILIYIAIGLVGGAVGFFGYKFTLTQKAIAFKERMGRAKELEDEIFDKAKLKAEEIVDNAHKKADKIEEQRQREIEKRIAKAEELESRLIQREGKLDEKLDKIEEQKIQLFARQKDINGLIEEQKKKLEDVANMTQHEAKEALFAKVEEEYTEDKKKFINKLKTIMKEEADQEAAKIIAQSLPRISGDHISEYTVVSVDLPSEDFKGRLIGREGRNIMFFEKVTGCELIIDDTPLLVRVSSFDHEKRFMAVETLKKMIKDAKINPYYIEKVYAETVAGLDDLLLSKGKEALTILNLPMMNPDIVKIIGQFYNRFSYGQNLWTHSIEVAKISEAIASELGLDPTMAKKAGLLHDIGKISAQTGESHARVGADLLRKFGVDPIIINAAESHHHDVPMTDSISWVVTAADAMSGARPGARFNTKELFVDKMTELEKLIKDITGVQKVHIMQAGREIMVYADPEQIDDLAMETLLKKIGEKIEEQLDYPGIIRVVGIREKRLVEFLR